jgi:hypothetical protein
MSRIGQKVNYNIALINFLIRRFCFDEDFAVGGHGFFRIQFDIQKDLFQSIPIGIYPGQIGQ